MNNITQNLTDLPAVSPTIERFFKVFQMKSILSKLRIRKEKGVPIIQLLLVLVSSLFSQKTLQKYYQSHANQLNFSDKTLRNLLNRGNIAWQSLLVTVAHSVIQWLFPLTSDEQSKVFIIDDSIYNRGRSKKSELVALLYNHATDQYLRGLRFLQLGWSDGHTFVPVNFALLSGKTNG